MKDLNSPLDRLLRAAAAAPGTSPGEMPFGFDTRVLARWRAGATPELVAVGRLLRRVVLVSLGVIVLAGAGVFHELRRNDELLSPNDEYAIADNAIGSVFGQ